MLFCTKCGSKRDEDAVFCTECGNNFAENLKTEPIIAEEVKTEPVIVEEVKTEPVIVEEVKTEPIIAEEVKTEPVIAEEVKTEPVIAEEVKTEPVIVEEVKTEPVIKEKVQEEPKKEKKRNILAQILVILLLISWTAFGVYYYINENEQTSLENKDLKEIEEAREELEKNQAEFLVMQQQNTETEAEMALKFDEIKERETEISAKLEELDEMQDDINTQLLDLEQQKTEFFELQESFSGNSMNSEYIFADSNIEYINTNELKTLSKEELVYARNEIYARHGHDFQSDNLIEYFNNKSWYVNANASITFDNFNDYEKANVEAILAEENLR